MDTYDLEFDSLTVDVDGSDFEVDSDGWHELFLEDIVSKSHVCNELLLVTFFWHR